MARFAFLLTACLLASACVQPVDPDSPYAPGVDSKKQAVDSLLVANRLMDAGEYDLALEHYSRAALTHGMTAEVTAGMGTASLGLGRLDTAEKLMRDAINKDEKSPVFWNNLGVVLMEKGQFAEAEQVFRRAYALDNGESDAIRDNLRLALANSENYLYDEEYKQEYTLERRGTGEYVIRSDQ